MEPTPAQVDLWFHYEEIAMHFNELIMQYRLQLMGGVGALGIVAAFLTQSKDDEERRYFMRAVVSFVLLILIFAAAILDLSYYNRLLHGAVIALLEFEKAHPSINMSTHIEDAVWGDGTLPIVLWYGAILGPVAWFFCRSYRKYTDLRNHPNG